MSADSQLSGETKLLAFLSSNQFYSYVVVRCQRVEEKYLSVFAELLQYSSFVGDFGGREPGISSS